MHVTLQHFDGCPHWQVADRRLHALADDLGFTIEHHQIDTPEAAEAHGFRGSPTILVDGRDPFAAGDEPVGLSCRVYATPEGPAGVPTVEQLRAVLAR
ncbi:MAG: thioredoxin family protein [Actinobacteria bacterium]|nr:thioredoxin family protein [Actinomycetota bacterium]